MKTRANIACLAITLATCLGGRATGQPADTLGNTRVNPQNGLPAAVNPGGNPPDPVPSLPFAEPENLRPQKERDRQRAEQERQDSHTHDPELLSQLESLCASEPASRRRLTAIRDEDAKVFSANEDNLKLFEELHAVNHALGEDEATHALFLSMADGHPSLAHKYEMVIETLLMQRGEYELCYQYMGNPESRFRTDCFTFRKISSTQQFVADRSDEMWRNLQATNHWPGGHRPYLPPRINTRNLLLRNTQDFYVHQVCNLIQILVATGHLEEAEKIRGEAVALLDDPRLQSAITQAEAHLKNPDTVPAAGETAEASPNPTPLAAPLPPPPVFLPNPINPIAAPAIPPPAIINPATGQPQPGSTPAGPLNPATGLPVTSPTSQSIEDAGHATAAAGILNASVAEQDKLHGWPFSETFSLFVGGHYAEALERLQFYHHQFDHVAAADTPLDLANPALAETARHRERPMEILVMWNLLAQKYPPAREALTTLRDQDAGIFSAGGGDSSLFYETSLIDGFLDQNDATVTLYKAVRARDPQLAGFCYPFAQASLLAAGEYALCLQFYGDAHGYFVSLCSNLMFMRTILPRIQENEKFEKQYRDKLMAQSEQRREQYAEQIKQRKQEDKVSMQQFRQGLWDQERTNLLDGEAADWPATPPPLFTPPALPALPQPAQFQVPPPVGMGEVVTNGFVFRVRVIVEILEGSGHHADAEKIRDEAVATLNDPRLISAVSDADNRIKAQGAIPLTAASPGK